MTFAPIALFAYSRPDHLRQTVASLQNDPLAARSVLWVFSDAPKRPEDAAGVERVRSYLRDLSGFAAVNIVQQRENFGLAKSIITGVGELCRSHGKVIVVEDDLVVAPIFLRYMNGALDRYESEAKVMSVSAYMYPVPHPERLPELFFCRIPTSWGWATWARAWRAFRPDAEALAAAIEQSGQRKKFDLEESYPHFATLEAQARGEMDVWGVRWYASVFLQAGLCLYPSRSLVQNTGMDGSGVHCGESTAYDVDLKRAILAHFPGDIHECEAAVKQMVEFFRSMRQPTFMRVLRRIHQRLAGFRQRA